MASFVWKSSVSGLWGQDSLWAGVVAPNATDADVALSPAGPYTVTVGSGTSVQARSLSGGTGVTLDVAGTLALSGKATVPTVVVPTGGRLSSSGTLAASGGTTVFGTLAVDKADAVLQVTKGTLTNNGTLTASVSGSYMFLNGTTLTNLSGGTLSGGTYIASGAPLGGQVATIDIARFGQSTEITTLAGTVVLNHVNSAVQGRTAGGLARTIDSTLTTIVPGGDLQILGMRNYITAQALSVAGRLELGGGTLAASGGLSVAPGGVLTGFGRISTSVAMAGSLVADGGVLRLAGGMTGNGAVTIARNATLELPAGSYGVSLEGEGVLRATGGTVTIGGLLSGSLVVQAPAGATLDLGTVSGGTMAFVGTNAKVAFSGAGAFGGIIAGFQTTNVLQLKDVLASSAAAVPLGADSSLVLTTAGGSVSLRLAGDYSGRSFQVAPDGFGGTLVTVAGVSFEPGSAIWTSPEVRWSFAQANYPGASASFSSFVDPVAQANLAALWRASFARWSAVSGLRFVEVADAPGEEGQADIRVGWGNFGNPPAGEIGEASFSFFPTTRTMSAGALVRLQDPSITPLTDGGGTLVYQGTVSSAFQVMLHEIGHALGLDHSNTATDPTANLSPIASGLNRDLNVSDITGIRALYSGVVLPAESTVSIAPLSALKPEGTGGTTGFTFTLTRGGDLGAAATIGYATSGSGANPATAADFAGGVLPSGTVTFAPGQASLDITIPVAADTISEADEGFNVNLTSPGSGLEIAAGTASGTIQNDDAILSVAAATAVRAEGQSGSTAFTFTVTRSGNTAQASTANWAVTGSGANPAAAADFPGGTLPSGTVSFAAGETSQTITVLVAGDSTVEPDEGFTVTLDNATGATIATATAAGTIQNDDASLSIAAAAAVQAEGHAGSTAFTFTVTRSGSTAQASTANWGVTGAGGSPALAADFAGGVLPSGTVSFAVGQTSQTITVPVAGDSVVEADEAFLISLGGPIGATIITASASGTILNDDASLSIVVASAMRAEGQSASTAFTFNVTRSGNTGQASTAGWSVAGSGSNPAAAADFVGGALPTGTVSFAAGETSQTITVLVAGDSGFEPDEGFTVTLANPGSGTAIAGATASGTIQNDDTALSIAAAAAVLAEGQSGSTGFTFTVTRSGDTTQASTADWSVAGSGANPAAAADFEGGALPSGTVSFAAGETSQTITVLVAGDSGFEPDEGFTVTLANPSSGTGIAVATASGTIQNDDAALSIAAVAAVRAEGQSGSTAFTFTVTRSGDTGQASTAGWSVAGSGSNPAAAADFLGGTLPSGTVSFPPGETSQAITVLVAGDSTVEPDEGFTVTLDNATGAAIATATAAGTIQNDDEVPAISVSRLHAARAEGQSGSTTGFTFLATRTGPLGAAASASWTVSAGAVGGTVSAAGSDFATGAMPTGVVSFAAGQASRAITVSVKGDATNEFNESFTLTLANPSAGLMLGTAAATGVIFNDDAAGTGSLAIARGSAQRAEGQAGTAGFTFTVTRSGDTSGTASADWAVTGGGVASTVAAAGSDFAGGVLPTGRVNFAAGHTQATVVVPVAGDGVIEVNESFTVTLAAPQAGVAIGGATATGVIMNDDFPPSGILSIVPVQADRGEGAGGSTAFTFAVTRGGSTAGPASANWAVAAGGATAEDFAGGVLPSGSVSFNPGQASQIVTVLVAGDTAVEADEDFSITLSGVPAGVTLGTATAAGMIRNDDPAGTGTLAIARASAQKQEGAAGSTAFTFTVTRSGDLSGVAAADWAVTGGTANGTLAASGADFAGGQLPAGRVSFSPGQATQTVTVLVAGDVAAEANESFTVTLANPQQGVALATAAAVGIILNDDIASTAANQTLSGSAAPDVFLLGGGIDTVLGRDGVDEFRFLPAAVGPAATNATTLQDLNRAAGEVINLAAIDAIGATLAEDAFSFIGTAAFSAAGQLRWQDQGATRLIQGEVNGDGVADVTIIVTAAGPVEANWFVL